MKQERIKLDELTKEDIMAIADIIWDWSNEEWKPIKLWGNSGDLTVGYGDREERYRCIAYKMAGGYHIDIVDKYHGQLFELTD